MSDVMYHLTPRAYFDESPPDEPYAPEAFDGDGFIHCTDDLDEVIIVANRYYRDDPREYVLAVIDKARVQPEVRYEDEARAYPHIYGRLNRDAIVGLRQVLRDNDGRFLAAVVE